MAEKDPKDSILEEFTKSHYEKYPKSRKTIINIYGVLSALLILFIIRAIVIILT